MSEPTGDNSASAHHADERGTALRFRLGDLARLVVPWLAFLLVAIVIAHRVTVTGPAGMSLPRATFFVLNAASLTGFDMTWTSPQTMTATHAAIWLIAVLLTAAFSLAIATAAFTRASGRVWSWDRIWTVNVVFLAIVILLAFALQLPSGRTLSSCAWDAVMVALGTGLLADASAPADPTLWIVRFPLAALAAIGPLVLIDAFDKRRRPSANSRLTWVALPVSFALAVALIVAAQAMSGDVRMFSLAAVAAVDARGAGFTDALPGLSPAARWTLVPVILLGGASGGVGGGLKALTAAVLIAGVLRALRGGRAGRTFAMAAVWLIGLATLFGLTFVLLIHTSPGLPPDRAAILAAGACANAGISVDPLSVGGNDAYVLAGAMLLGRALPWIVLWWSATRGDERIAVG